MTRKISILLVAVLVTFFSVQAQNWSTPVKNVASDRATSDYFGKTVAISGDYAIVGAEGEDHDVSGSNFLSSSGSSYILKRDASGEWSVIQKIVASDRSTTDYFGGAVDISGDYAVVGAIGEAYNASGGAMMSSAGAVYIFKNISGTWTEVQKIVPGDRSAYDYFGKSVAISDDYLIVGAFGEDHDAAGANLLDYAGSAYIFKNISGTWTEVQKVVASDRGAYDYFGSSTAISGDYIIVGAYAEDHDLSGGNMIASSGSAYIYKNNSGTWTQVQKIVAADRAASTGDSYFGSAVSISGDYIIVGAYYNEEGTFYDTGAGYIFRNISGTWSQVQKLIAPDRSNSDYFGRSVSISGDYAVVGASGEDEDASGGNTLSSAGSAYIFKNNSGTWTLSQKIVSSDRGANEYFGFSTDIESDNIIAGAYSDSEDASGVNPLGGAGSVFIFKKLIPVVTGQPVVQSEICSGSTISFSVSGNNIVSFKWQLSTDGGGNFSDISDNTTYSNSSTNTLSVVAATGLDDYMFRCIVSNDNASVTSGTATLTIDGTNPLISCVGDQERNIAVGQTVYTALGTEFDPASANDNCSLEDVLNDFNNTASLAGTEFPTGITTVTWTATDKSGNSKTCSFNITVSVLTDITESTDDCILIYPNPTEGIVTIKSNDYEIISVRVVDLKGKTLIPDSYNQREQRINISSFRDGIYIFIIQTNNGVFRFKVLKK